MKGKRGYTIIEMLACVALLGVLMPAISQAYVSMTRLYAAQVASLDGLLCTQTLEQHFRDAARRATGMPTSFGPFRSAEGTLILSMPEATEVYTVDAHGQALRLVFTPRPGGGWDQRNYDYPIPGWTFRFAREEGAREIVCVAERPGKPRFHLLASLPGLAKEGRQP